MQPAHAPNDCFSHVADYIGMNPKPWPGVNRKYRGKIANLRTRQNFILITRLSFLP